MGRGGIGAGATTAKLRSLGYDAYQSGRYKEAASYFAQAIAKYPKGSRIGALYEADLRTLNAQLRMSRELARGGGRA